jgi:hypothetical protein
VGSSSQAELGHRRATGSLPYALRQTRFVVCRETRWFTSHGVVRRTSRSRPGSAGGGLHQIYFSPSISGLRHLLNKPMPEGKPKSGLGFTPSSQQRQDAGVPYRPPRIAANTRPPIPFGTVLLLFAQEWALRALRCRPIAESFPTATLSQAALVATTNRQQRGQVFERHHHRSPVTDSPWNSTSLWSRRNSVTPGELAAE